MMKLIVDLFECFCPECGPNHCLDHTGEGEADDAAWCEACGWEGVCADLEGAEDDEEY